MAQVIIIGGGLAGCEAAWQLAEGGVSVLLYEMRPKVATEAHKTDGLAELVCSNSFRGADLTNAVGLLKEEMRRVGSLIMLAGQEARVPAGGAFAVDRVIFSDVVTKTICEHKNIEVVREEVRNLEEILRRFTPQDDIILIIATGPLTSNKLAEDIKRLTGEESLFFYDAISPVVYAESLDMNKCFRQSRYDKGGVEGDYLNLPMSKDEYLNFVGELLSGEKVEFKDFEKGKYFEGCLPIEVMAERGVETLRFGPMKPVGLVDPRSGKSPYAVVQLRQENRYGTLYNMVGFQTKLKFGEQIRIFKMIPGLENAEFARLGSLHRNTFINTPKVLDQFLRLRSNPNIFFAGQMTGVEGYVESAACGLMVGRWALDKCQGRLPMLPPMETAFGSLIRYITQAEASTFQPMNINFGLFPPLESKLKGRDKKEIMSERALNALNYWLR